MEIDKEEIKIIEDLFPLYKNGNSKREIRHAFFTKICTHIQSYMLGFIASDGCVNEMRHALIFQISNKDKDLLDIFKLISPEAKISQKKSSSSKGFRANQNVIIDHGSTRLVIHSKSIYESLVELGITERKTYKELHIPKQIPEEFINSFILGYLDGDGYITTYLRNNSGVICKAGICSKTSSLLLEIQKELAKNNIVSHLKWDKRDNMYSINTYDKKSLINLYNYFYNGTLGLQRKKIKLYNFLFNYEFVRQECLERKKQREFSKSL